MQPDTVLVLHTAAQGALGARVIDGGDVVHLVASEAGAGWHGQAPPDGADFWVRDDGSGAVRRDGAWVPASVIYAGGATLQRNAGVVDRQVLADRSVAVVGLGSGGAAIADLLARAGVGELVVVDRDRLEPANIGRHLCDERDLGRRKTRAVSDALRRRNPEVQVTAIDLDVVRESDRLAEAVRDAHVLVSATDSNPSRRVVNQVALDTGRAAIFGRAYARAAGGDVLRVLPSGPCFECVYGKVVVEEEVSSERSAGMAPYADTDQRPEPGLYLDIAPVAQMVARLALVELLRGTGSAVATLAEDFDCPLYIWGNRREGSFENWKPMRAGHKDMAVHRWYGLRAERDPCCPICNEDTFLQSLHHAHEDN